MIKELENLYKNCRLCARLCGVDRTAEKPRGFCGMGDMPSVARASLHMWEEPIISGTRGSGTIFFSGCSLGCVYCQNREISMRDAEIVGENLTDLALADVMLRLEERGAHNVNLVTPTHFVPSIIAAVNSARAGGLSLPIVYNTASYETVETIKMLEGTVDVYLADFKYYRNSSSAELSGAENYPEIARAAIAEMVRQKPTPVIEDGIMKSGVVVRILLLPAHVAEAKLILKYLYLTYGDNIYISLMNQYTPPRGMRPPLDRTVTRAEYSELLDYAERLGVTNAFIQEGGTAKESFIPNFRESEIPL